AFDYTYKWGTQNGDTALESSSELQAVFREHNTSTTGTAPPPTTPAPTTPAPTTPAPTTPPPAGDLLYGTSGADVLRETGAHTMIGYGGNDD
ncbi:calcium-binding protein, partial [Mesorhizobium sp. BHbsci]